MVNKNAILPPIAILKLEPYLTAKGKTKLS